MNRHTEIIAVIYEFKYKLHNEVVGSLRMGFSSMEKAIKHGERYLANTLHWQVELVTGNNLISETF